uniref:Uncharacterized protein n=1 Tax=Aegilops tauschii subsp. strangulata TaxID=200361 RepID=A0A453B615_AEGTS
HLRTHPHYSVLRATDPGELSFPLLAPPPPPQINPVAFLDLLATPATRGGGWLPAVMSCLFLLRESVLPAVS